MEEETKTVGQPEQTQYPEPVVLTGGISGGLVEHELPSLQRTPLSGVDAILNYQGGR